MRPSGGKKTKTNTRLNANLSVLRLSLFSSRTRLRRELDDCLHAIVLLNSYPHVQGLLRPRQFIEKAIPIWSYLLNAEDLQLLLEVGYHVAQTDRYSEWKTGTELNAKREKTLGR
jgi:hypothetical protein